MGDWRLLGDGGKICGLTREQLAVFASTIVSVFFSPSGRLLFGDDVGDSVSYFAGGIFSASLFRLEGPVVQSFSKKAIELTG